MSGLFLEIGTEELPARFAAPAAEALAAATDKLLGAIPHGALRVYGTPRRLAVAVPDVAPARPSVTRLVTGPPAAADPAPFARGRGVDVSALRQVDGPKGKVWAFDQAQGGEPTRDVVAAGLEELVLGLPFKRTMRWGSGAARFGRPIRHVCAVLDGERVPARVAGLDTVSTSDGHWLLAPERFEVRDAAQWLDALRARYVLADRAERRDVILAALEAAAAAHGALARFDEALLDEVTDLVEAPSVVPGRFAEALLALPPRLLVESMKVNQRYFPLYDAADGALTARFLVVTNNPAGDPELIGQGNARVLAARFHDARFFYAEDRKQPLASHRARLEGMTWIRGLGTMAERQDEVCAAAVRLAVKLEADPAQVEAAGKLCKCDLTTQMVGEFPELQGHVGRLLAEADGVAPLTALAIEEHYLPRFAGDATPSTRAGCALALAERLTLLARAFAAGLAPKGSADPQGLRRAANGVVAILLDAGVRIDLRTLFRVAGATASDELVDFVVARLRATLLADGIATDLVEAVLAADSTDLSWAAARALCTRSSAPTRSVRCAVPSDASPGSPPSTAATRATRGASSSRSSTPCTTRWPACRPSGPTSTRSSPRWPSCARAWTPSSTRCS